MLTVLIGVVLQFVGYYGMWAAAIGRINPPYYVMILLALAACNGQTWYETAGLVTSVRNFETERCGALHCRLCYPVLRTGQHSAAVA